MPHFLGTRDCQGYRSQFELNDQIVVMGLDSATTGRMGVTYYRELLGSEFFQRFEDWHTQFFLV